MKLCSVCLCNNRNLQTLGNLQETFDIIVQRSCSNVRDDPLTRPEVVLCFECRHLLKKCQDFKRKAELAQEIIIAHTIDTSKSFCSNEAENEKPTFSSLVVTYKNTFDYIFSEKASEIYDNNVVTYKYTCEISSDETSENDNINLDKSVTVTDYHTKNIKPSTSNTSIKVELEDSGEESSVEEKLVEEEVIIKEELVELEELIRIKEELVGLEQDSDLSQLSDTGSKKKIIELPVEKNQIKKLPVMRNETKIPEKPVKVQKKHDVEEHKDSGRMATSFRFADAENADDVPSVEEILENFTRVLSDNLSQNFKVKVMTMEELSIHRESKRQERKYADAEYKCVTCVYGFISPETLAYHNKAHHAPKGSESDDTIQCPICSCVTASIYYKLHYARHFVMYVCQLCDFVTEEALLAGNHLQSNHPKKNMNIKVYTLPELKKYPCPECDIAFPSSRSRASHVARTHREGFQCDHCKKRFVNRSTLTTHLRLHESPLPCEDCPICHKLVRVVQLKRHIKRHESKSKYECKPCQQIFSHLATYQAHLKYSRAHASDEIFKFPCPMCNKKYAFKEKMQDHFNYQHLGKTSHKCPICSKPIATRGNIEKHVMRVHGQKREKPRSHVCKVCGKGFTENKTLNDHLAIHSSDRLLSCHICQMTFKHRSTLYTHRKAVHKVPLKKNVQFMG